MEGILLYYKQETEENKMTEESIIQTLKDVGCEEGFIQNFMELKKSNQQNAALSLLKNWRNTLLDRLHKNQHQLDCLDYLLWQMERGEK